MAEEGDESQEKTEDPSQRKLDKAAEDGQVLTSKASGKASVNVQSKC